MADKKFPLSLIVRAIDQASGPLKAITANINMATGPLSGLGKNFSGLGDALHLAPAASALKNIGSEAFALVTRFAGLALGAGVAFGAIVKGAMEAGDQLGENAQRVGFGVDTYAALRFAAEQADVPQEMFASSLDKLNKQMGDFRVGKGGEFLGFLNEISPTFAKQMKATKTSEEGLALLTDAFSKIDDPTRRATLAAHAFGKSNAQMGVFLHQGWGEISKTADEYLRLSGSQEAFAKGAGDLDNATRSTETAFLGLRNAAASALFPALTKLSNITTEFLVKHRDGIAQWAERGGAAISAWVDSGGFERLVGFLGRVSDGAGKVIDFLGPMGVGIAAAAVTFGPLGVSILAAIPPLTMFAIAAWAALAPILPFVAAGVGLALAGKQIYDSWDAVKAKFEEVGDTLRWALVDGWAAVRPIISAMSMLPGFGTAGGAALKAGDFAASQTSQAIEAHTGQSVESINARNARASADSARPFNPAGPTGIHLSKVSIDFKNLPPGVVVSDTGSQPVDMSMGWQNW